MVYQYLRWSSLNSKDAGEQSKFLSISKSFAGLLFGFGFGYASRCGHNGGVSFSDKYSGGCNSCNNGYDCGSIPTNWLTSHAGCCQLWDHVGH